MMQLAVNVLGLWLQDFAPFFCCVRTVRCESDYFCGPDCVSRGLAASNALVVADLFIVPEIDLYRWRLAVAATAMLLLVYGLIFESDRS